MDPVIELKKLQQRQSVHGWILYSGKEKDISPYYVDLYRKACEKAGMSAEFGICSTDAVYSADGRKQMEELAGKEKPAFIISRTRNYRIAELFENMGIPVFNSSQVARLGNDKAQAYAYMQKRGIPVMPFVKGTEQPPHWYPAVVKSCDGHGGTEVYLIRNEKEWGAWRQDYMQNQTAVQKNAGRETEPAGMGNGICGKEYIIQKAASDTGRDVRVYIVGNQIAAAVLRTSDTDFRSNFCLGGKASLYTLREKERELVQRAADGLEIGMAGIDFIFHNGEMVFNEIEDVAGARGLYLLTDYDIVDAYVKYIQICIQRSGKESYV